MEDVPETYNLETLQQLRAVADKLRVRILRQLTYEAMTVTQLASVLDEVPAKLHYHVHELEKVGLLKLVETREKGGILEKYYRTVARTIQAPPTLLQGIPPNEVVATLTDITQPFFQGAMQLVQHTLRTETWDNPDQVLLLSPGYYWMTADEFLEVNQRITDLVKPYKERRGIEREHEQALLWIGYTIAPSQTPEDETRAAPPGAIDPLAATQTPPARTKREMNIVAGGVHYGRKDLEKIIAGGASLDMYLLGVCVFADDVTPDLVERAIGTFRLWGKLIASPEVRDVLKHKGGDSGKKSSSSI